MLAPNMDLRGFKELFRFDPTKALYVGVERECFIVDATGVIVPEAVRVLNAIAPFDKREQVGYELSACQVEHRTGPCRIEGLCDELVATDAILARGLETLPYDIRYDEIAPESMPLDVFPDPTGRYQRIVSEMPVDILRAACRVTGTHIHIGMPDHETALAVYDRVVPHCDVLARLGDRSGGERLRVYAAVATRTRPVQYGSWQRFYEKATAEGFADDPRRCWTLIRISTHGTLEFRMFGSTAENGEIVSWAQTCRTLCEDAM